MMAWLQNSVIKHERVNEGQGARLSNSALPPEYFGLFPAPYLEGAWVGWAVQAVVWTEPAWPRT